MCTGGLRLPRVHEESQHEEIRLLNLTVIYALHLTILPGLQLRGQQLLFLSILEVIEELVG